MAQAPPTRTSSWVAAGMLAILTVFVFTTLRHYGPASALRRFHEAVFARDARALSEVSMQKPGSESLEQLSSLVAGARTNGARVVIEGSIREPNRVVYRVQYKFPNNQIAFLDFVVKKPQRNGPWLVDAEATLQGAGAGNQRPAVRV
jgi:hypothetical protein